MGLALAGNFVIVTGARSPWTARGRPKLPGRDQASGARVVERALEAGVEDARFVRAGGL